MTKASRWISTEIAQENAQNKTDEEPRKNNEKDDGRKKGRLRKDDERRSRSKEDRVERDANQKFQSRINEW